jgi:anti-sigma regulatory factor (Ser/Thr protein kinase)
MVLTANTSTVRLCVSDDSYIGTARRSVRARAAEIGLSGAALDKLDILSTELGSNLCKYAASGREILCIDASVGDAKAVTMVSVDRGPGIADVDKALADGVSTRQTLGAGLGSLKRLSDIFEISSAVGKGTIVISTVYESSAKSERSKSQRLLDTAWISVPHPAEQMCGDGVSVCRSDHRTSFLVVDGLGHGADAADASRQARSAFEQSPFEDARKIVARINTELSGSRGAALAITQIEQRSNTLNYVGVGNITSRVYAYYSSTGCVSTQGIVGEKIGTPVEYTYDWAPGSILLMHSDGIKSSATLEAGKTGKSALMLAAEIYRDYYRGNDDATVVVSIDKRSR